MISPGLIEFLMYLIGPLVLISFLRGRHSQDNSIARKYRFSKADYFTYCSLLGLILLYLYQASFAQPPNVFKRINASPLAPCHMLREKLADYVKENPSIIPPGGVPTAENKMARSFDIKAYYSDSEYGRLDFLVDRFCMYKEDRDVYLKFGEDAFLNSISSDFGLKMISPRNAMPNGGKGSSKFLTDLPDIGFLLYAISMVFFTYLPAFALVGLLTTPFTYSEFAPSRIYVRPWGVVMLCTLFFSDFYWTLTVPTSTEARMSGTSSVWIISPDQRSAILFFADSAAYTRALFLAFSLFAFLIMDYTTSSRQTDIQLLKKSITETANVFVSAKNRSVLDVSIMLSDRLRDRYVAQCKREQKAKEMVLADAGFAENYEKVANETMSKQWAEQSARKALNSYGV